MPLATCDLSILIVNWNTRELLAACLESVAGCRLQVASPDPATRHLPPATPEVIVVDNASTDGSAAMVRERFPWVHLIENRENIGFARANNQGITQANGQYIMLLNPDTIVLPGAIKAMIEFLDTHPQVGLVGPKLIDGAGNIQLSWADFPTLGSELIFGHRRHCSALPDGIAYGVDWLAGACLMTRRGVIDAVGLMDERFFLYSEETDWCLRIKRAGWNNVYFPAATVMHFEGSSAALDTPRTSFLLLHSKLLFFDKHYGRIQSEALRFGLVALAPLKALRSWLRGRPNTAKGHMRTACRLLGARYEPLNHG